MERTEYVETDVAAAIVEAFLGVKAERQSLESVARPLSEVMWLQRMPSDVQS